MEPSLRNSAIEGRHNFIAKVAEVLNNAGIVVGFDVFGAEPRGATLSHMKAPRDVGGLLFRRVYHYPFWQIERSAERWDWDTAQADFPGAAEGAGGFFKRWQTHLFGTGPTKTSRDGFIYVPLQGRLRDHRSFQQCSPISMLEHCLTHAGGRRIVVGLHPKESYSPSENVTLKRLERENDHLTVQRGGMEEALRTCDFVVTQNSSVAFNAMFFEKPSLLFAKIDFHHICVLADLTDLAESFSIVADHCPDYAGYVHWFWQLNCINAGREDAKERIAARFRRFGWLT
ncbi:hypothetical protein [Sulfitobacter albidus]|nr:hypothetical protein [Sulfitobacter albidus]